MPGTPATTPHLAIPRYSAGDAADFPTQVNAVADRIDTIVQPVPVCGIVAFAGTALPDLTSWAWCKGGTVNRTIYNGFFSRMGSHVFGNDPGTGTPTDGTITAGPLVRLPDLRGRVPVGADETAGRLSGLDFPGGTGGEEKHATTIDEMPTHTHFYYPGGTLVVPMASSWGFAVNFVVVGAGTNVLTFSGSGSNNDRTIQAGGNIPHNNMQPFQIIQYIIRIA